MSDRIRIEVAYGLPDRQELVALEVEQGTTVAGAIADSGIAAKFPGLEVDPGRLGIFGRKVTPDEILRDGDRVEIYRPLLVDPKEVRRARALKQKG